MTQPQHLPPQRVRSLDGLRGIAAVVVLLHHLVLLIPAFAEIQHRRATPTGAVQVLLTESPLHVLWAGDEAVIVFFVLSGFALATPAMRSGRFRWAAYYPARLLRLYIPVFGAVALSGIVLAALPSVADVAQRFAPRPGVVGFAQLVQDATLIPAPTALNNALWSLHYELAFSLLLPLYLVVALRVRRAGVLLALSICASTLGLLAGVPLLQLMPIFLVGVLLVRGRYRLAAWVDRALAVHPAVGPAALAAVVCALPVMWYPLPAAVRTVVGWPLLLLAAAGLVVLAAHWAPLRSLLARPLAARLGTISFSLYLTHIPMVLALSALIGPDRPVALVVVALSGSLLVAVLFHRFVEAPGHRAARRLAASVESRTPAPRAQRPAAGLAVRSPH